VSNDLHMDNTFWGVALPQAAFALPMTVVILRPFLMAIPRELEEAALIDGAVGVVVAPSGPARQLLELHSLSRLQAAPSFTARQFVSVIAPYGGAHW
jgi:hypothetical protein